MYVCEQVPGANSSPIVTKLGWVIPLATGDEVMKFWKVKAKGQGRWERYALYWAHLVPACDGRIDRLVLRIPHCARASSGKNYFCLCALLMCRDVSVRLSSCVTWLLLSATVAFDWQLVGDESSVVDGCWCFQSEKMSWDDVTDDETTTDEYATTTSDRHTDTPADRQTNTSRLRHHRRLTTWSGHLLHVDED